MVGSLRANTRQQVVAVGSREVCRAQDFADRHGIARAHGSYEELVADPLIDIVYVASPHSGHREHALLASRRASMSSSKAFAPAMRPRPTRSWPPLAAAASSAWRRCGRLPGTDVIRQCLEQGLLGPVEVVFADHGSPSTPTVPADSGTPELAGGAPPTWASTRCPSPVSLGGSPASPRPVTSSTPVFDAREAMIVTGAHGGTGVPHATMTSRTGRRPASSAPKDGSTSASAPSGSVPLRPDGDPPPGSGRARAGAMVTGRRHHRSAPCRPGTTRRARPLAASATACSRAHCSRSTRPCRS